MKITYFLFLFITLSAFSQEKILAVTINSIIKKDTVVDNRKFTLNYQVENLTDQQISFFFNPNGFNSSESGSKSNRLIYKIFQKEEFLNLGTVFQNFALEKIIYEHNNLVSQKEKDELLKKYIKEELKIDYDSIMAETKKPEIERLKNKFRNENKNLLKEIFQMNPKQIKSFSVEIFWDKTRYYTHNDNEFYLDENAKHYLEITLILLKSEFKDQLTDLEFQNIMTNKNFLNGVFLSNKMEIDFGIN